MARIRNKTAEALDLRLPDFVRHVEPDETTEIADDIFSRYEWPESTWDVVESGRKSAASTSQPSTPNEAK